jgi:hypothetical protein
MSNWTYKGKTVIKQPLDYYGFVYRITVEHSEDLPVDIRGKIYIGKKQFAYRRTRALSKKKRKTTKKRVERIVVDSKWLTYFGSNKQIIQDVKDYGEKYFKREILHLCFTKAQMSYYEVVEQIAHKVLMVNSYNGWISCKIFKNRFTTIEALEAKD